MWSWKWAVITLGPPVLLVLGITAYAVADQALYAPRPFDAERWRAGDPLQRKRMAGDLIKEKALVGRTRDEVVALLGPDDRDDRGGLMQYLLIRGHPLGLFDWHEWLLIRFDRDTGRVCEATFFD